MKNKVLIIGRHPSRIGEGPFVTADLLNNKSYGEQYVGALHEDLLFDCLDKNVSISVQGESIDEYKSILCISWFKASMLYEDTIYSLSSVARSKGITVFNSETIHRSKSKLSQYVLFGLNGLPYPRTIFSHDTDILLAEAQKAFDFPFIIKTTNGSRGEQNYLVHSTTELSQIIDAMRSFGRPFCAQQYIKNKGDLRVLVMNNTIRLVIHRSAQAGTHLNNTSQGGSASIVAVDELSEQVRDIALRAAQCLRREVCGVDIMFSSETGEPYLLEVNNMPQLVTGSFVDEKIMALAEMFHE